MKRRIRLKPRFWVILAVIVLGSVILLSPQKTKEEPIEFTYCVEPAEVIELEAVELIESDVHYLDIPLSCELQDELYEACKEFGVEFFTMVALIERETKFTNVMGDGGESYGYCQIQPKWWYGLMNEIGATDLKVPKDNFRTGCAIMAKLLNKYGSVEGALVAYNQGYYNGYSTNYSRDIMANAKKYREEKCHSQSAKMEAAKKKIYKSM